MKKIIVEYLLKPSLRAPLIPPYIISLNFPTFRLIIPLKIRLVQNFNYLCIDKYALTDKNEQLFYDIQAF